MNDSSTGGYIGQTDTLPINDGQLDDVLQQLVVGITRLDGSLVRPRWQRPAGDPNTPPTQPAPEIDWCSIGVLHQIPHDYPYEVHVGTATGYDIQASWETLDVIASFFGPNCRSNASTLRSGLYINQNRDSLIPYGIKLREVSTATLIPDAINVQWINRCDLPIIFDREIIRTYPIRNIESAKVSISADVSPIMTDRLLFPNPMPV